MQKEEGVQTVDCGTEWTVQFLKLQRTEGMAMSKPMHFKCPNCGEYVRCPVRETRMDLGGIYRRRDCEVCGIVIETLELITGSYKKKRVWKKNAEKVSVNPDSGTIDSNV